MNEKVWMEALRDRLMEIDVWCHEDNEEEMHAIAMKKLKAESEMKKRKQKEVMRMSYDRMIAGTYNWKKRYAFVRSCEVNGRQYFLAIDEVYDDVVIVEPYYDV